MRDERELLPASRAVASSSDDVLPDVSLRGDQRPASLTGALHFEYMQLFRVHKDHIALLQFQLTIAFLRQLDRDNFR